MYITFLVDRLCKDVVAIIMSFLSVEDFYGSARDRVRRPCAVYGCIDHKTSDRDVPRVLSVATQRKWHNLYWKQRKTTPALIDLIRTDSVVMLSSFIGKPPESAVVSLCHHACLNVIRRLLRDHQFTPTLRMLQAAIDSSCLDLVKLLLTKGDCILEPSVVNCAIHARSLAIFRYFTEDLHLPVYASHFEQAVANTHNEEMQAVERQTEFRDLPSVPIVMYMINQTAVRWLPLLVRTVSRYPVQTSDLGYYILARMQAEYLCSRPNFHFIFRDRE